MIFKTYKLTELNIYLLLSLLARKIIISNSKINILHPLYVKLSLFYAWQHKCGEQKSARSC